MANESFVLGVLRRRADCVGSSWPGLVPLSRRKVEGPALLGEVRGVCSRAMKDCS